MNFITRFAPSPTGELHLGHAYSALMAYEMTMQNDGQFILRFEDIDASRVRPQFYRDIEIDLEWLGMEWNGRPRRQSEHLNQYSISLQKLQSLGLIYKCYKTRTQIALDALNAPHENSNIILRPIDKNEDDCNANAPFALRFWALKAKELLGDKKLFFIETNGNQTKIDPLLLGDVILARKDTPTSYHLCVVHDDALQNISHIVRGEDLRDSTHIHVLLQYFLRLQTPIYHFHTLILGSDGKRLAKRDKSQTLKYLRNSGLNPDDIREMIKM